MHIRRIERDDNAINAMEADLMMFADQVRINESTLRKMALNSGVAA